jgi:Uma2 family endonuclease
MATRALFTAEQYFATNYSREPELVHGEIVERPLPTFLHGSIQLLLGARLLLLQQTYAIFAGVEVRVQIAPDLIRIPDIAVWTTNPGSLPIEPALVAVEITSPDDRLHDILAKFEEYQAWGVAHIWLVEPELKRFHVYNNGSLNAVDQLTLPQFNFSISTGELFGA